MALRPISRVDVRLDRKKKKVIIAGLLANDLAEYPQYGGLPSSSGTRRS